MTKYNPTCNVDSVSLLISASYQLAVQYYLLLKTQKPCLYISIWSTRFSTVCIRHKLHCVSSQCFDNPCLQQSTLKLLTNHRWMPDTTEHTWRPETFVIRILAGNSLQSTNPLLTNHYYPADHNSHLRSSVHSFAWGWASILKWLLYTEIIWTPAVG